MSKVSSESNLARFIRTHNEIPSSIPGPSKITDPVSIREAENYTTANKTQLNSSTASVHTIENLHEGVQQLQKTIDNKLQTHLETFRREYKQHWLEFNTDYIQPSVQFIGNEKKALDNKYQKLEKEYQSAKSKCADLERYNTLLQEKIEAVENDMQSLTQVSMIARWEKKLANKSRECDDLRFRLEKEKLRANTLQTENTFLNTQLEKWSGQHERGSTVVACTDSRKNCNQSNANNNDPPTRTTTPVCTPPPTSNVVEADFERMKPETNTEQQHECVDSEGSLKLSIKTTDGVSHDSHNDKEDNKSLPVPSQLSLIPPPLHRNENHKNVNDQDKPQNTPAMSDGCDGQSVGNTTPGVRDLKNVQHTTKSTNETESVLENIASNERATESTTQSEKTQEADPPVPKQEPQPDPAPEIETVPQVTYVVKKLKRRRTDKDKTTYMLGSDSKLYEWTSGDVPGVELGYQSIRNGTVVYKFHPPTNNKE